MKKSSKVTFTKLLREARAMGYSFDYSEEIALDALQAGYSSIEQMKEAEDYCMA